VDQFRASVKSTLITGGYARVAAPMRSILLALGLSVALLSSSPAWAQYANRSIGVSAGYLALNEQSDLGYSVPLGLLYTNFITDLNIDLTIRAYLMILRSKALNQNVVGATPSLGLRYLFSQESVRPYVGLDITYLHVFYGDNSNLTENFVGVSPTAGIDFFLNGSFSVGLRAQYSLYPVLNGPWQTSYGATVDVATYY